MALAEAGRFYNNAAADIARAVLASAGIESVVFDGQMSAYTGGGLIPARLMVVDDDLAAARALLGEGAA